MLQYSSTVSSTVRVRLYGDTMSQPLRAAARRDFAPDQSATKTPGLHRRPAGAAGGRRPGARRRGRGRRYRARLRQSGATAEPEAG